MDHDPRLRVAVRANALEERHEVVDVGDEVGEDDVVERLAELELLSRRLLEPQVRMP